MIKYKAKILYKKINLLLYITNIDSLLNLQIIAISN